VPVIDRRQFFVLSLFGLVGCRNSGKPDRDTSVAASSASSIPSENKGIVLNISDPVVKFKIDENGGFKSVEYSNRDEILASYGLNGNDLKHFDAEISKRYDRLVSISGDAVKNGKFSYIPLQDRRNLDPIENYNDDPERHSDAFAEMGFPVEIKCTLDTPLRVETDSFALVRYKDKNTGEIKEAIAYTYRILDEGKGFDLIPIRFPILIFQGDQVIFVDPKRTKENAPRIKPPANDNDGPITFLTLRNLAKLA
jgi:hypothetical protein